MMLKSFYGVKALDISITDRIQPNFVCISTLMKSSLLLLPVISFAKF